jgi:hypothetical protein
LEEAIQVPTTLKDKNGGNPWSPDDLAGALRLSKSTVRFFYLAAASREFGLTEGGRDSKEISLAPLGRDLVYAPNPQTENELKLKAFLNVDIFKRVLEYYQGNQLPEMKYLSNTLSKQFGLHPETHEEFSKLFRDNCDYLGIGSGFSTKDVADDNLEKAGSEAKPRVEPKETVTLAEPETDTGLTCFVIMPFREHTKQYPEGFFNEVLRSLIAPAGRTAGFTVTTANRQGTDVIQSTIVNDLLEADLVVADLSEQNPNVLFELGLRMAYDKPIALIRARGTGAIFDVDNMLRVFDYDPNLWTSTIERDLPKMADHIKASWDNRNSEHTYMKLLKKAPAISEGTK